MENNIGGLEVCVCVHQAYTWALTHFGTSKLSGMLAKMAGTDVVNVGRINSGRQSDLCIFLEEISTGRRNVHRNNNYMIMRKKMEHKRRYIAHKLCISKC